MTCNDGNTSSIYNASAMDPLNITSDLYNDISDVRTSENDLNWYYTSFEILVGVVAVVGNALVIAVFSRERRLRRRTNYYIVSLAVADLLVGLLGIPFAILTSVGLPSASIHTCLFTVSLLMVLCTISIFCLVAVSVDRYWAILHPMDYSRNVRTRTAIVIIAICWFSGSFIGFIPLMGWHKKQDSDILECYFLRVMDYNYLVFAYFATIIAPALLLAVFYIHIYHVVLKQIRRMRTLNPESEQHVLEHSPSRGGGGGTMLRFLGAAQKREVKATQNLSIIVLFFMVCWIPLYTINCVLAFCHDCINKIHPILMNSCIILSHVNSAGNPLLYAYHLKDFRAAMKRFILCMVGVKMQPHLMRPNASQVTMFNSYYQQYRCRSQQYLPQLANNKNIGQCLSEVPLRNAIAPKNQDMDNCSPTLNGDHINDILAPSVSKLAGCLIVRNTVNLATAPYSKNKDKLWRISSSSHINIPSTSDGDSDVNSSECNHQTSCSKNENKSNEELSLMYLNLHTLNKPSNQLNNYTRKEVQDYSRNENFDHFVSEFTDFSTVTHNYGVLINPRAFTDLNDRDPLQNVNNRSRSCSNLVLNSHSRSGLAHSLTKPGSVFHIDKEVFAKKYSASATCCAENCGVSAEDLVS